MNKSVRKFALSTIIFLNFLIFSLSQGQTNHSLESSIPSIPQNEIIVSPEKPKILITDPELIGVQVPIPKEFRTYNKSGSQCVWCSLETLARYHKIERLYDLTKKYKHASGPGEVARVLKDRDIKFFQTEKKDISFLEEYVKNRKLGCGVGLNGTHAVNVVHFDKDIVKIIDNSDRSLKIQTWSMKRFISQWDGWAFVLIPDVEEKFIFDLDKKV
jgi:hypothetical protein